MFHLDPAHTGNDTSDPSLSVAAARWSSPVLDGRVYGEPLVLGSTVYVASQANTIYALDLGTGSVIWQVSVGPAVPLSAVQATTGVANGCGNIDPLGIVGTPVIDPARGTAGTLYAAAETWDGSHGTTIEHRLYSVDLGSHSVASVNIDPSGYTDGAHRGLEQERGALALSGGRVAVPYGGLIGDCGAYRGALVSAGENLAGVSSFLADPTSTRGGIWAHSGAASDASGNFYVTTGNGDEASNDYQYSDGVVKLSPTMSVIDYFAPTVWHSDNQADLDLGSMGPVLVPRPGGTLVFASGKQHTGFLLDAANLGHIGGQLFSAKVCDGEAKGGAAYNAPYLYVPCTEGIRALKVDTASSPPTFARQWQGPSDAIGSPILAGGSVWVHGNGVLYALNPATGGIGQSISGVNTPYNFSSASAAAGTLLYPAGNVVRAFTNSCTGPGGYQLDGWGGLHPYCSAPNLTFQDGYWPGWDIARGLAQRPDGKSGYVLDGWGGVHEFASGTAPPHVADGSHAYWQGWDIARGIVLDPCDPSQESGYVLDGWGGIHEFTADSYRPPHFADSSHAYWPGWDIARGIAINPCTGGAGTEGGYVLDGYGGVHAFGSATAVADTSHAYWAGWDIARGLVVTGANGGYTLDGWGGIHRFGTESHTVADNSHSYWPGWDIARGIVSTGAGQGYTLDGWGGIHPFGGAKAPTGGGYWQGWDIARGISH